MIRLEAETPSRFLELTPTEIEAPQHHIRQEALNALIGVKSPTEERLGVHQ
jgi:hypothetical protein